MNTYKIQLHCHSNNSHDGKLSPIELIDAYRAAGFDGIAITDHDHRTLIDSPYDDFIVLHGAELSKTGKQTLIIEDKIIVMAHPGKRGFRWTLQDIAINKEGCNFIEVYNGRTNTFYKTEAKHAASLGILAIYSDDAHDLKGIGRGWLNVDAERLTKDLIIDAILEGQYRAIKG